MPLLLTRIDRTTGDLLVDERIIYNPSPPPRVHNPDVTHGPWEGSLHLVWLEQDDSYGYYRLIRHAIIDLEGNFIIEHYTAYDSPTRIRRTSPTWLPRRTTKVTCS